MENFKIHFNKVSKEDEVIAENLMKKDIQGGAEKISGEYEKNEEELKAIEIINNLIQKELKELEVNSREFLVPERVHLIDQQIANSLNIKNEGAYSSEKDAICINKELLKERRLAVYITILHEALHYYSYGSKMVIGKTKDIGTHRTGYSTKNILDSTTKHEHFRGLNEAIIEKTVRDILQKNRKYLTKEFNIKNEEVEEENKHGFAYPYETEILGLLIEKIASFKGKTCEEIWVQLKKGLFTGEMMQLRNVEEVFGPGSLRVLSAMTSKGSIKNISMGKMLGSFERFFKEENQDKRNSIAKQILSERERLQYEKIIKNGKDRNMLE